MLLLCLILIATAVWLLLKYIYSYWDRKKFPNIRPSLIFGNLKAAAKQEKSFGMAIYELYQSATEPFVGIYLFFKPALLIRDAKLVKNILTSDFNSFHDRGIYVDEEDTITGNLFALKGSNWKSLRAKLTPAFSSGKLKNMFVTIEETGKSMQNYLEETLPEEGGIVELKDLFSRYVVDIIASVIFGLEINSFKDPHNEFKRAAKSFTQPGILANLSMLGIFLCPSVMKYLPKVKQHTEVGDFMTDLVRKIIDFREKNNYSRKDLMQLLLQLRNTGKIGADELWNVETVAENLKSMSAEQIASQLLLFYIAGYETSSSALSFCIHELTQNKEIMAKVKEDINQALRSHDGQLTYDCIQDMKYLDLCLMETFRKYPGLPLLNRECTEDYTIPETDHIIENGTPIVISVMGLHRDPDFFPDPMKFQPERFSAANKNYEEDAYLPFGEGPRSCIGIRMGKINVKVGIVMFLTKFNVEATDNEYKEIEIANYSVGLIAKDGINVKVTRIKS